MMGGVIGRRPTLALRALGCMLLLACGPERQRPLVARPRVEADFREVPIGLCEDHPPESTSDERMREDFRSIAQAGVRVLRVSFGWDDLEPERDRYDFSPVDQVLRAAAEQGVRLIPYVCYTPPWLAPKGAQPNEVYRSPPTEVGEFEQLMELLAARYRGRFASWELWNEPDNREYWLGSPAEYAALLAAGSRGVKRGDPSARVVLGGIAGHLEFLEELLAKHDVARVVDVVNLHSYYETWNPEPLEALSDYLTRAAELVRAHGEGEPLWLAEVGYSSFRRGNFVSSWTTARFDFEHTAAFQAAALLRVVALARTVAEVEQVAWYELRDLPPGTEVIGDQNNRHLGVLDAAGQPKPAFHALARAVPMLSAPLRPIAVTVRTSEATAAADIEARAFQRADGQCLIVTWRPTQRLPAAPTRVHASFALEKSTPHARAHAFDALGELATELPLQAHAPVVTAPLELIPERTHVITIDDCH
jgi:hypothetical protein